MYQHKLIVNGREYSISTEREDIDQLYVASLQNRLEEKVAELKKNTPVADTSTLMVLLAVETVDELEQMKNKLAKKDQHLKHKIQNIIQICDEALA